MIMASLIRLSISLRNKLYHHTHKKQNNAYIRWVIKAKPKRDPRHVPIEEKIKYMQELAEEQRKAMEEQEALAMQQTLGVDEQQWKIIAPKLKSVKHYREQAFIGTKPPFQSSFSSFGTGPGGPQGGGGFAGGGASFQFQAGGSMSGMGGGSMTPMGDPDRPLTDGERIIEELQWLLHDLEPNPTDVRQKMNELRKAREKAFQQWVRAQEDLRKVLNLRQEATLMMMGLLN